ncbi:hypothetical protein JCM10213v2_003285 [Rhodosporidiobolus nylandii]
MAPRAMLARVDTHKTYILGFTHSGKSFRQWNQYYEEWLKASYSPNVRPFVEQPLETLTKYATVFTAQHCDSNEDAVERIVLELTRIRELRVEQNRAAWTAWNRMSPAEREEVILKVWQEQVEEIEKIGSIWGREDAPELLLEPLANKPEILEHLFFDQLPTYEAQKPFRRIPHPEWDRLNGALPSTVPPKPSVAAYTRVALASRHYYIARFTFLVIEAVLRREGKLGPDDQIGELPDERIGAPTQGMTAQEREIFGFKQASGVKASENLTCVACAGQVKRKLVCSGCKKVGRSVVYCSAFCSTEHWKIHKRTCGKTTSAEPAPQLRTLPNYSKATSHQQDFIQWLLLEPEAVWGVLMAKPGKSSFDLDRLDIAFKLPRTLPYWLSVLDAGRRAAFRCLRDHDEAYFGVILLFCRYYWMYFGKKDDGTSDGKMHLTFNMSLWYEGSVSTEKGMAEWDRLLELGKETVVADTSLHPLANFFKKLNNVTASSPIPKDLKQPELGMHYPAIRMRDQLMWNVFDTFWLYPSDFSNGPYTFTFEVPVPSSLPHPVLRTLREFTLDALERREQDDVGAVIVALRRARRPAYVPPDKVAWYAGEPMNLSLAVAEGAAAYMELMLPHKEGQKWDHLREALKLLEEDSASSPAPSTATASSTTTPDDPDAARAARNRKKKERKLASRARKADEAPDQASMGAGEATTLSPEDAKQVAEDFPEQEEPTAGVRQEEGDEPAKADDPASWEPIASEGAPEPLGDAELPDEPATTAREDEASGGDRAEEGPTAAAVADEGPEESVNVDESFPLAQADEASEQKPSTEQGALAKAPSLFPLFSLLILVLSYVLFGRKQ